MNPDLLEHLAHLAVDVWSLPLFKSIHFVESCTGDPHCFGFLTDEGVIEIRTHTLKGAPMAVETIIDTICHELAHLAQWAHSKEHKKLTKSMYVWYKYQYRRREKR